jgi:hypothetical protein
MNLKKCVKVNCNLFLINVETSDTLARSKISLTNMFSSVCRV